jgi:hypothetical protein
MTGRRFRLEGGHLTCDGRPFFAVGVNYHPSRAGCRYWRDWDAGRIDDDLRAMAEAGLNAVRIFLFWADFEPHPGQYDTAVFDRLVWLVSRARERGIGCVPSLLTLWMNGQVFDLPWRAGRSLWTDRAMVLRAERFVAAVAAAVGGTGNVIAYDLGDELPTARPLGAAAPDPSAVAHWRSRLAGAIRAADQGAVVIQANELSTAMSGGPFSLRHRAPLDLAAAHAFPTWAPFEIESHTSEKATHLVPFLVRLAAAFGPPLVDELGCYGASEEITAGYLRTVLPSAAANGALGVFVWCWQDISSTADPYALRPGERLVGLRRADGRPKAGLRVLQEFAATAQALWAGSQPVPGAVALYVPEIFGLHLDSYLDGGADWSGLFYAYLLLKRAHLPFELTTEPDDRHRLVICPSVPHITQADHDRLLAHCSRGGVVYYSPGSYLNGFGGQELFGVELVDFTLDAGGRQRFEWDGRGYDLPTAGPGPLPVIRPAGARVLASFADRTPALTEHAVGAGRALYLNAPFETSLNRPYLLDGRGWEAFYLRLGRLAGVDPLLSCGHPHIEVQPVRRGGETGVALINHGPRTVACEIPGSYPPPGARATTIEARTAEVAAVRAPAAVGG